MAGSPASDVEAIAAAVIGQVVPEELAYFAAAAARFRSDPGRPPATTRSDDALGFGEHIGLALSPFALWLTQEALSFVAAQARPVLARATRPFRQRLRQLLGRVPGLRRLVGPAPPPAAAPAAALSQAELAAVRAVCLDRAAAVGLPPGTAEVLADAIVGRLALPT